ncbi:glycine-rich cell wall structural protein 1.0-like [Panicum virgatum]|uniref:glycine-rich cell wall structural protein 1.0-like n=1 Tax=Panicum virgatum TaxID=38727 RepID=UPI0019D660A7|nr:glycine-rich cell wall structural protein 1.0-like [Panicum virgatum]
MPLLHRAQRTSRSKLTVQHLRLQGGAPVLHLAATARTHQLQGQKNEEKKSNTDPPDDTADGRIRHPRASSSKPAARSATGRIPRLADPGGDRDGARGGRVRGTWRMTAPKGGAGRIPRRRRGGANGGGQEVGSPGGGGGRGQQPVAGEEGEGQRTATGGETERMAGSRGGCPGGGGARGQRPLAGDEDEGQRTAATGGSRGQRGGAEAR